MKTQPTVHTNSHEPGRQFILENLRWLELEGILGFGIRKYMLRAPGYYICEDAEYIKTISEVNKYVANDC